MKESRPGAALGDWGRRYPPLLVFGIALILGVFALPSALNLPQANPGQTLEYAPVPGDQGQAPVGGNFAGLGLGQGGLAAGSVGSGSGDQVGMPPPPPLRVDGSPSKYQCVGSPPRQTEDSLSPPCVAFYSGDNGGATYSGVSAHEIQILFYFDMGDAAGTSMGDEPSPAPGYYDIDQVRPNSFIYLRALRLWQEYFNNRYQTYGRRVHFHAFFSADTNGGSVADRRTDASDNFAVAHPFAVFDEDLLGNAAVYVKAMSASGVLNFGGHPVNLRQHAFYTDHPGLVWGYSPAVEQLAHSFASFVCSKAQPNPVSFSGDPTVTGPRKFGLLTTTDPAYSELIAYGDAVAADLTACGVQFTRQTYSDWLGLSPTDQSQSTAATNMAAFKQDKVTTVLWPVPVDPWHTHAATSVGFHPEWLVAGGGTDDGNLASSSIQDQSQWANAWDVTPQLRFGPQGVESSCFDGIQSIDPSVPAADLGYYCQFYDALRQFFTGVQVSGPRIDPAHIEQGYRAIPAHTSSSPFVPACYYISGDYTCVKDEVAEWWDPSGTASGHNGCWRMTDLGRRYVDGRWPSGDVTAQKSPNDPCNTLDAGK